MATSASENPTQSWEDLYNWACRAYGLTDKTIQILEEQDCNTAEALAALTEDDLKDLEITVGQRRLVANMLADLRTAWDHNLRLERELRRAFPRGKYMIKAYYSEEEEKNEDEVLEAVTISAVDNEQDEVLIYCKAYITFLKTGKLEDGDQLFTFVEEAVAKMNDGVYKGALLLLPQETFLPRSLAEKLLDEGDMFPLRHTDTFITDVRKDVKLLMDREEEEEDGEEDYHEELETGTPERSADPLLQTKTDVDPLLHLLRLLQPHPPSYTPSQLSSDDWQDPQPLLDEYWRGTDKINHKTPVTSKTGKPDSSSKVSRKLFLSTPGPLRKDGLPDMRFKGNRVTYPRKGDGTPDLRYKANREVYGEDYTKSASSGHLKKDEKKASKASHKTGNTSHVSSAVHVKKDGTPDMRFKENKASKVSSSTAATTKVSPTVHVKKDGTPDRRYKENKMTTYASLSGSGGGSSSIGSYMAGPVKKDGTPDMRYAANKVAHGSSGGSGGGYSGLCNTGSSSYSSGGGGGYSRSSYSSGGGQAAGPLKSDGTPDMRYSANKVAYGSSGGSGGYGGSYSTGQSSYSSGGSVGYSHSSYSSGGGQAAGPLKSDGTPDMRYSANKVAYGSSYSSGGGGSYSRSSYSSGGGGGYSRSTYSSGGGHAAGPLKSDGTPDMRYAANRR